MSFLATNPSPSPLDNGSYSIQDLPTSSLGPCYYHGTTHERFPLHAGPWSGSDVSSTSNIGRFQQDTVTAATSSPSGPDVDYNPNPASPEVDTDLYLELSALPGIDPVVDTPSTDTGVTKRHPGIATPPFPI
jgi:hypothetical protein